MGTTYHVMNGTEKVGDEIVVASVTKQQQRRGEKENLKYTVLSCARYTVHENLTLLKMLGDDKYDMHSRLSTYVKLIHDFTGLWRSAVAIYMGVCACVCDVAISTFCVRRLGCERRERQRVQQVSER